MLFEKGKALLVMKFCSALFLIFMLYRGIHIVRNISTEFEEIEKVKENEYDSLNICSNYYIFHIFAFVLGAFWNVKKLIKVGIV